ncbi:MAG: AAA family ATPase [Bacillota bacterium]|jgi:uncharacterized protein YhaN|nr:AAA family ATPase [Bacillota bacterium]
MRLISLKIENFGNLSEYTLSFERDLTVIFEDNGFGKTTLAEFIKTMFYGFPRATKSLAKNSRKKNQPWQGGAYGGNLVFEYDGVRYRIERTFGSVPREDTFLLYDVDTNERRSRFSENIGLELFELDADSFERSVYLPQVQNIDSFSTSNIQAKLGDLVQDTNDIMNFDKALQALKSKRSSYIPLRGSGGSVADAERKMTNLQGQLEQAEGMFPELDKLQQEIEVLEGRREGLQTSLETTRKDITLSAEASARKTLEAQHQALQDRLKNSMEQLTQLQETYPAGMASESDVDQLLAVYDRVAQVGAEPEISETEKREEAFVSENAIRFVQGVPNEEDFEYHQEMLNRRISCVSSLKHADLSANEKKRLQELEELFSDGIPHDEDIAEWEKKEDELKLIINQQKDLELPADEITTLRHLEIFFAPGLPDEEVLSQKKRDLAKAEELRNENLRIAVDEESLRKPVSPAKEKKMLSAILFVLGLCGFGAGVLFFVQQYFLFGGIFLATGIVLLLAAVYLRLRQMVSGGASSDSQRTLSNENRAIIQQNEQEAASIDRDVLYYIAPYISDDRSLSSKLSDIETKLGQYVFLKGREKQLKVQRQSIQERINTLTQQLQKDLASYPLSKNLAFHDMLVDIRAGRSQLIELKNKLQEHEETVKKTQTEIDCIDDKIKAFLQEYYESVSPDQYSAQLSKLQKDVSFYLRAQEGIEARKKQKERREQILAECGEELNIFSEKFTRSLTLEDKEIVLRMRDDIIEAKALEKNVQEAKRDFDLFSMKHRKELATPFSDIDIRDLDELKEEEKRTVLELTEVTDTLTRHHQRLRVIQEQTDKIPSLQDDLAKWAEERKKGIKGAELLDQTIELLQQSKDSLSRSYLGTIYQSFTKYMKRLLGEDEENIFVTQDLDVQMERRGAARELGYFSAGQIDIVMLCMRFALVDALFGDKKSFVILDDPFMNLDDDNTEKALNLLKDLSEEHQIIYMTCSSSREPFKS